MQHKQNENYRTERKRHILWRGIAACLAVLVMMGTSYALVLPALTMEQGNQVESAKETEADWESTLPGTITGNWGEDLAAAAESQIGYAESSTDVIVNEAGETSGYTRYGAWYGDEYGAWNGMFLSFCLHYAGIPEDAVGRGAEASEILRSAGEKGSYREAAQYEPKRGDIAFLSENEAGIVIGISEGGVSVAEGDAGGKAAVTAEAAPVGYVSIEAAEALYTGNDTESSDGTGMPDADSSSDAAAETENNTQDGSDAESAGGNTVIEPEADESTETAPGQMPGRENEADGDPIDLKEYVLSRGYGAEKPGFNEALVDADGVEIEKGADGKYHLYEGEPYYWKISFYAPAGIPNAGTYVYEMPEGFKAEALNDSEIRANDGETIGKLVISEDNRYVYANIDQNTKIKLKGTFSIQIEFEKNAPDIEFVPIEDESGTVEKTGKINSDGQLEWTITAHIPAWDGNEDHYHTWHLSDQIQPSLGNSYLLDWNKAEIIIEYDNNQIKLHSIEQAQELGEDIAYYWRTDNPLYSGLYFVFEHEEEHLCDNALEGMLPENWCTDWKLQQNVTISIKYIDQWGELGQEEQTIEFVNTALLYCDLKKEDDAQAKVERVPVIQKSELENGRFTITFNAGKYDITKYEVIKIKDCMSENLFYQYGSIQIIAEDHEGFSRTLTYGEDYTLKVSKNLHRLCICLLKPENAKYTISYGVTGEAADINQDYSNKVKVHIYGKDFEDSSEGKIPAAGFTAEEYVISMVKTDADSPKKPVEGAQYGIYSSSGELLAQAETDENGMIHFTGDPSKGFILSDNMLYYLQEIEAPEHYQLSDTRYWFYYDDSDGSIDDDSTNDPIDILFETAKVEGMYREGTDKIEAVTNHGYTDKLIEDYEEKADPIKVTDQRIWYRLPDTGSTGTKVYTIAGLFLTGSAVAALYKRNNEKRKWRREG